MNNRIGLITALALAAGLCTATADAQQDKSPATTPTIAGTWNISLAGHPVGLVLEQDGTKLTGTLMMMSKDVPIEGTFADGAMSLIGVGKVEAHGPEGSVALKLTGTLKDDGTMAGEFATAKGPLAWTAERLRQRPTPKAQAAAKPPAPIAGVAGTWNMLVIADHGVPIGLVLEQTGKKVTGTMMIHGVEAPLDGEFVEGELTLASTAEVAGGDGQTFGKVKLKATLKEDGTLAGEIETARGPIKMTAERLKKRG